MTKVVHDHTSILATIEAQWNLPACTYRDANAKTLADFLDPRRPRMLEPPKLAAAPNPALSDTSCSTAQPPLTVHK